MKAKPPVLPCRDDVLVENGAAAPKLCLSPFEIRSSTAAGGLLPAGKASTMTRIPFSSRVFNSAQSRRRILRRHQLNTPCITTAVSDGTSFLPPPDVGLHKQNQGKIRHSMQAVPKVAYAPSRFWERGARCFVENLVLERLVATCSVFWRKGD